jgi:hypothetical protein
MLILLEMAHSGPGQNASIDCVADSAKQYNGEKKVA